jgi:hypothetical protein
MMKELGGYREVEAPVGIGERGHLGAPKPDLRIIRQSSARDGQTAARSTASTVTASCDPAQRQMPECRLPPVAMRIVTRFASARRSSA